MLSNISVMESVKTRRQVKVFLSFRTGWPRLHYQPIRRNIYPTSAHLENWIFFQPTRGNNVSRSARIKVLWTSVSVDHPICLNIWTWPTVISKIMQTVLHHGIGYSIIQTVIVRENAMKIPFIGTSNIRPFMNPSKIWCRDSTSELLTPKLKLQQFR